MKNSTPTNDKGPVAPHDQPSGISTPITRKFNAKSTCTGAQYLRIAEMLRAGTKTTFDFRRAGVMSPAARIKEMNERYGWYIATEALRAVWDEWGYEHRGVAVYALVIEPGTHYGKTTRT